MVTTTTVVRPVTKTYVEEVEEEVVYSTPARRAHKARPRVKSKLAPR